MFARSFFAMWLLLPLILSVIASPSPVPNPGINFVNFPNGTIEMAYLGDVIPAIRRDQGLSDRAPLELEDRSPICKLDAILLACKALAAKATPFCSSYLGIPTSTRVVVTTPTLTTIQTAYATTPVPPQFDKRGGRPVVIPSQLSKFLAAELSSACSCLSIQPTVTVTTTTAPPVVITTTTTATTTTTTGCLPPAATGCNLLDINDLLKCCNFCCFNYNGDPTQGECCPPS